MLVEILFLLGDSKDSRCLLDHNEIRICQGKDVRHTHGIEMKIQYISIKTYMHTY